MMPHRHGYQDELLQLLRNSPPEATVIIGLPLSLDQAKVLIVEAKREGLDIGRIRFNKITTPVELMADLAEYFGRHFAHPFGNH